MRFQLEKIASSSLLEVMGALKGFPRPKCGRDDPCFLSSWFHLKVLFFFFHFFSFSPVNI